MFSTQLQLQALYAHQDRDKSKPPTAVQDQFMQNIASLGTDSEVDSGAETPDSTMSEVRAARTGMFPTSVAINQSKMPYTVPMDSNQVHFFIESF